MCRGTPAPIPVWEGDDEPAALFRSGPPTDVSIEWGDGDLHHFDGNAVRTEDPAPDDIRLLGVQAAAHTNEQQRDDGDGKTQAHGRLGFEPEVTARLAQAKTRIFEVQISFGGP